MSPTNIDAALAYARVGWYVIPIWPTDGDRCACPLGETCTAAGKHPLADLVPAGQRQASRDPSVIAAWWTARPDASIAIALAESGLFALDIDVYKGDDARLRALLEHLGPLPLGPEQRSGSGAGVHLIYRAPPFPVRGLIGDVTTRARNYIVVAPSLHRSGGRYTWEPGAAPWDLPAPELPVAWLAALRRPDPSGAAGVPARDAEPVWLAEIDDARRLAAARTHLAREPGEVKGVTSSGTAWHVARTAARGYAVRDTAALLDAVVELYDARCSPPYGRERCADRVAKVYLDATEPSWGYAWRPSPDRDLGEGPPAAPEFSIADVPPAKPRYRSGADLSAHIAARAAVPWLPLRLGGREIVSVRAGGIALLIGGTGAGKSSLALSLLLEHAHDRGPALLISLELPADEAGARAVGIERGASWGDVLRGVCADVRLPDMLAVVERRDATMPAIAAVIDDLRERFPGKPILLGWDYTQIVDSEEREKRLQVADAMERIDALSRARDVVSIALSQGSRASASTLKTGEKIGAETTSAGAEAAELERWSTVTLAIGEQTFVDGSDHVKNADLSIGKWRMGQGDRVLPMLFNGRSGAWSVNGDSRSADDVRAERAVKVGGDRVSAIGSLIKSVLEGSERYLTRGEVAEMIGKRKVDVAAAIAVLLADPTSGVVECALMRGGARPLWSRARAEVAGLVNNGTPSPRGINPAAGA